MDGRIVHCERIKRRCACWGRLARGPLPFEATVMLNVVLSSVLPVLLTIVLGFLWVRYGRALDSKVLTPIVVDVGTPCLIVSTLLKAAIAPEAFATVALASCVAIGAFAGIGALVLWALGLRLRTYLPSIAFPNAGNLGLPLALYAFGPEGLGYAIVFFAISSIGNHSIGQALAAGTVDWKAFARMPMLYAITIGLVGSYFHIEPPTWFSNTISLIGGLTIPVMLLMLGGTLAKLQIATLSRAIGANLFRLPETAKAVFILQCAMPVAVYCYLYAERWECDPEEVAGLVFLSTAASLITVPVLLSILTLPEGIFNGIKF
jgi:malate permease and related proteins